MTQKLWAIKPRLWPQIEFFSSGGQESRCIHVIQQQPFISFSNAWKWKMKVKSLSRARLLVTPWTAAHQAPPSMGFSRKEYWSGVPFA